MPDDPKTLLDLVKEIQQPEEAIDDSAAELVAQAEQVDYNNELLKVQLSDLRRQVRDRGLYTPRLYWLMVGWMICVLAIIVAAGIKVPALGWIVRFELTENVLMALIGGTSANVIGLFVIVAKHLFPKK